jgi:signal recognition particle receptor subunit beta
MVFFNYATMQMAAKIVYYGPGLCGKTTNLHHIYTKTSPQSRGEMVSLETETDRTLFFDLLPIDVGVIGGFKTRLQLYTIPGQVFYNTTRKLVLKGVDGVVFVADSQIAMLDANVESFSNLKENLAEIGLDIDDIPLVLQLNKRDLPNIAAPDTIVTTLDGDRKYDYVEAVASKGEGVFETLKLISKLTLRQLRRRMTGEEPIRPAAQPRRPASEVATFRVKESGSMPAVAPRATVAGTAPLPPVAAPSAPFFTTPAAAAAAPEVVAPPLETVEEPPPAAPEPTPAEAAFTDSTLAHTADVGAGALSSAPVAEPEPAAPPPEPAPPPPAPPALEPEIDFARTEKPAKKAEVKHVKVRSSVDIMAELESLRKRATAAPPKSAKKEPTATELILAASRPKRDVHKTVSLAVAPGVLPKSKNLRFTVSFENEDGIVQTQEQSVELGDTDNVGSLSVNVKFDI